jgi:hypothetical protein
MIAGQSDFEVPTARVPDGGYLYVFVSDSPKAGFFTDGSCVEV